MKTPKIPTLLKALAAAALALPTLATAGLVARNLDGDTSTAEAYFDTVLGITWLRNAMALPQAAGLAGAGMSYADAQAHLAAFNANTLVNFGHSGWRLPLADGVHTIGGAGCQSGFSGSTDCGENVDTASSELAHLFHATLGNLSWRDTTGAARSGTQGVDFGLANDADFDGVEAARYWSGTSSYRLVFGLQQTGQVSFDFLNGTQGITATNGNSVGRAWLVHDGDIGSAVASVPTPGSLALAGAALLALRATARRGAARSTHQPS